MYLRALKHSLTTRCINSTPPWFARQSTRTMYVGDSGDVFIRSGG